MKNYFFLIGLLFYASLFGQVKGQLIKEIENSPEDYLKTFNQNSNFSDYAFRLFGDEQYIVREDKRNNGLAKLYLLVGSSGPSLVFEDEESHYAVPALSLDGSSMYVSKSDSSKKNKTGNINLSIALYKRSRKGWKKATKADQLSIEGYNFTHPFLLDDTYLYFASDQPGGFGGMDLYRMDISTPKSAPENLGPQINSRKNDLFPFVDQGILYFTSNGHSNNKGYDLFSIAMEGEDLKLKPLEMLNSPKDDFGYAVYDNTVYFSSNRGKAMSDDIFLFDKNNYIPPKKEISGFVKSEQGVVDNALVMIQNPDQSILSAAYSDDKGYFKFSFENQKLDDKKMSVIKDGFVNLSLALNTPMNENIVMKSNSPLSATKEMSELVKNNATISATSVKKNVQKKSIKTSAKPIQKKPSISLQTQKTKKYNIIVGSFKSERGAKTFIGNNPWKIILSEGKYRVSAYYTDTSTCARNELKKVRQKIKDAWLLIQ